MRSGVNPHKPLVGGSIPFSYPSGYSGEWNGSISSNDCQNVTVTFTPLAALSYSGNIIVNSDKNDGTNTRICYGNGIPQPQAPKLTITVKTTGYYEGAIEIQGTENTLYTIDTSSDMMSWKQFSQATCDANGYALIGLRTKTEKTTFFRGCLLIGGIPTNPRPDFLVWIPPGTFTMGSPSTEKNRRSNEGPLTPVTISRGFWMSKYEVTQKEYKSVMITNPSYFKGDLNRPVEWVSWIDANNYCSKLTKQERTAGRLPTGYTYRLPTEAEWEYACRAGTTTRFSYGNDFYETNLENYAWCPSNSGSQTHEVGQKLPNPWGLYDMHGNVWEWCLDFYSDSLPGCSVTDPKGSSFVNGHMARGGSYVGSIFRYYDCRSAYRNVPEDRHNNLGFRPVLAYPIQ